MARSTNGWFVRRAAPTTNSCSIAPGPTAASMRAIISTHTSQSMRARECCSRARSMGSPAHSTSASSWRMSRVSSTMRAVSAVTSFTCQARASPAARSMSASETAPSRRIFQELSVTSTIVDTGAGAMSPASTQMSTA